MSKTFGVTAFTNVGHIIHVNLKEHLLANKHQIGKELLEKNKRALAVVNKVNTIDNEYRNFNIEVIAKRDDSKSDEELMIVEVNENKCRFQFDFSKVYWNSRLSTEHERMINKFTKSRDVIFDIFAGVGPFSIPAAKAKCNVYANDLNPESVKWLQVNIKRNKINNDNIKVYNLDAKDFIRGHLKENLLAEYRKLENSNKTSDDDLPDYHFVMNLPAMAIDFLVHFIGLLHHKLEQKEDGLDIRAIFQKFKPKHIVHCYCFLKGTFEDPTYEVRKLVEDKLGRKLNDEQIVEIFRVRNVAPYKEMFRVDFLLDEHMLFDVKQNDDRNEEEEIDGRKPNEKRNFSEDNDEKTFEIDDSPCAPKVKKQKICKIM